MQDDTPIYNYTTFTLSRALFVRKMELLAQFAGHEGDTTEATAGDRQSKLDASFERVEAPARSIIAGGWAAGGDGALRRRVQVPVRPRQVCRVRAVPLSE